MLPKTKRIPRRGYPPLLKSRSFFHSAHFILRIASNQASHAKAAVSVSKKVSKSAVARNTLRRRVYGLLGELLPAQGALLLFIAKPGSTSVRGVELRTELTSLLKQAERSYNAK